MTKAESSCFGVLHALCFCGLKSQQSPIRCPSLQATSLLQAQTGLIHAAPSRLVNNITPQTLLLVQTLAEWWGDPKDVSLSSVVKELTWWHRQQQ